MKIGPAKRDLLARLSMMEGYPEWTAAHTQMYAADLAEIDDAECPALCAAIAKGEHKRPSVARIFEIRAELSRIARDQGKMPVAVALDKLRGLVRKFGANGVLVRTEIPGTDPVGYSTFYTPGEPDNLSQAPIEVQMTVRAFGGWQEFAHAFDWSNPADRAHFSKYYEALQKSEPSEVLLGVVKQYRLEKSESKLLLGETTEFGHNAPPETGGDLPPEMKGWVKKL